MKVSLLKGAQISRRRREPGLRQEVIVEMTRSGGGEEIGRRLEGVTAGCSPRDGPTGGGRKHRWVD